MGTQIRARVLIPTLLFVVISIPAILVPMVTAHQAEPLLSPEYNTDAVDPMRWETKSAPLDSEWQLDPGEVGECLECYLGK
ncbi:MAG: hypothetical protein MUP21_10005 [Dehalococcoidia bacterium]|nr:hypothetical protein [Dehalococcoidia bacterium]